MFLNAKWDSELRWKCVLLARAGICQMPSSACKITRPNLTENSLYCMSPQSNISESSMLISNIVKKWGWTESDAGSLLALQTFSLESKSVHKAKFPNIKYNSKNIIKNKKSGTCIDAKSPEAQAPRIAAPTRTDSTSLDRTTGLPIQEKVTHLLGRIKQCSSSCTINNCR